MKICAALFVIVQATFTLISANGDPPRITLAPKSQKVAEDFIISLFCKASGNPQPTFYWEKSGKRINPRRNRYFIAEMNHGSVLRIEPVRANRDENIFTCIAENGVDPPAKANATLHVYPQDHEKDVPSGYPRISINPSLKSVEKDRNAILQCEAEAVGMADPPNILWLKDYVPADLGDPRLSLLEKGSLQIERSQESDGGKYECVAENEIGVAYSYAAMLYVKV